MSSISPLTGVRVLEMEGLAPGPYCGMILSDFGANVAVVRKPFSSGAPATLHRGKHILSLDTRLDDDKKRLYRLIVAADVIIDPFRPGVLEKLGFGPEVILKANPSLIICRLTGYGQTGPLSRSAGHDINYLSVAGALSLFGRVGDKPYPPTNYIADFGGGGMFAAMGVLLALLQRHRTGVGQVIDAAMIDGVSNMSNFLLDFKSTGLWSEPRGGNIFDGGAPFYDTYKCSCGGYMAVGAIEPQFYLIFLKGLDLQNRTDLPDQLDQSRWPELSKIFGDMFLQRSRDEWCKIFDGTDACVTPVITFEESSVTPHNVTRDLYIPTSSGGLQSSRAPRLSSMNSSLFVDAIKISDDQINTFITHWEVSSASHTKNSLL